LEAAKEQSLQDPALSPNEKGLLGRVTLTLDPADEMFIPRRADHYLKVGLSAMRCIDASLENSNVIEDSAPSILDFPCGHGRVLRFLRARYPSADITVSEIDVNAINFCEETFKCHGVVSSPDFDSLTLPGPFDLIWCGSLLTHLSEEDTKALLRLIFRHLSPKGTCIITTHGQLSVDSISRGNSIYGLRKKAEEEILSQFEKTGYGYAGYKVGSGWGISVVSRDRMQQLVAETGAWRETSFIEHGWLEHQDVYALRHN
jgi:SAM-dependent methyltransferase